MNPRIKPFFKRTLGFSVTITLIISFFTPSIAQASEPTQELTAPPTKVVLTIDNSIAGSAEITATVDKPLEDSSSVLSLYKVGDPLTVAISDTGLTSTFNVTKPTSPTTYQEYYVTVGEITSNTVTVTNDTNNWYTTISVANEVDTFKTHEATPTINWNVNQELWNSGKSLYIIDKTAGRVVHTATNGIQGSWNAYRFTTEPHKEYYAAIADYSPNTIYYPTNLTGIVTTSNSLFLYRHPWDIQISFDKNEFSTTDADPILTWVTNQKIGLGNPATNAYSVYIANADTGQLLKQFQPGSDTNTATLNIRPYTGSQQNYVAYVAKGGSSSFLRTNVSQLEDIQATSSTLPLTLTPWTLSITIDQNVFSTDSPNPKISWLANQTLSNTGGNYVLYLADEDTGEIFNKATTNDHGEATIPRFYGMTSKRYVGYIAGKEPQGTNYVNVTQLTDVRATSNTVSTETSPWEITLDVDHTTFTTDSALPELTWTTNQSISNNNNTFLIYIIDETENKVIKTFGNYNGSTETTNGKLNIPKFYNGGEHVYKAYIAKSYPRNTPLPTTREELENIQATSNSININRTPWEVSLQIDRTIFSTDDQTPKLTWTTNQDISGSLYKYVLYIADNNTGEIIQQTYPSSRETVRKTGEKTIPRFLTGGSHSYTAYVAKGEGRPLDPNFIRPTNISELEDIQATSETVSTARLGWEISLGIDKTIFTTDETPTLTWTTNQSINKSGKRYCVYIVDNTTGVILSPLDCSLDNTGNQQHKFTTGGARSYTAYVAQGPGTGSQAPTHRDQLEDIQATSGSVTTQRATWNLSLELVDMKYVVTPRGEEIQYTVRWNSNQPVRGWESYEIYVFSNGKLLQKPASAWWEGTTLTTTFEAMPEESASFIAYIASPAAYGQTMTIDKLEDIQAVSNIVNEESKSENTLTERFKGGTNPNEGECNQQCYGDPVNTYNGELFENYTDITIPGPIPFNFSRSYSTNSLDINDSFGTGWTHNYNMKITSENDTSLVNSDKLNITQENGSSSKFTKTTQLGSIKYVAPGSTKANLTHDNINNQFIMTRRDNMSFLFNDSTGLLEKVQDLNGNTLTLTYTNEKLTKIRSNEGKELLVTWVNNKISSITDGMQTVTYDYSPSGNLSIVDLPDLVGHKQYVYDSENYMTRIIHPNGGFYQNFFDNQGRIIKQVNPMQGETLFNYSVPQETRITLPDGTLNIEKYNKFGQLVETKYAAGTPDESKYSYEYDFTGQVSKEIDPAGNQTKYTHDIFGNVIHVTNAKNATTSFTYNQLNQLVEITDALGQKATNEYDTNGNLLKSVSFEGETTAYEFNPNGTTNSITSPKDYLERTNKKTTFGYDDNGHLIQSKTPENSEVTIVNNTLGNPLNVTNSLGNTTSYTYNGQNQLIETIAPNGATTTATYDNSGQATTSTDQLGNLTTYTYDLMGNVLTITTVNGTLEHKYDNMQRVVKTIYPNGGAVEYEYDNLGRVIKTTDALGNESTTDYTNHSLVESTTDARGNTTSYVYDTVGNTIKIIDPLNNESQATYDLLNRVTSTTSSTGYTETYNYDKDSRLLSKTEAGVKTTSYEYDHNSNLTKTTYSDGSTEEKTYNADNEIINVKDRDGKVTSYQYDAGGQVSKTVRPDASEVNYAYTNMGELDSTSYDNWVTIDTEYEYNIAGQIISEIKNGVKTTYAYDSIGQLTSRGPPNSIKVEYDYNSFGQLNELSYPNGTTLQYVYDLNNNVTKIKQNNSILAEYVYDANGNNTRVEYGNGIFEQNDYDDLNRLTQFTINNSVEQLYKKELELDSIGFIIAGKTSNNGVVTDDRSYSYNNLQQLKNVKDNLTTTVNDYQYDTFNNLLSSNFGTNSFSSNGQLQTSQLPDTTPVTYLHDDRGNRTQKTVGNTTTKYGWTPDNKLNKYVSIDTANPAADFDLSYKYDARGLLAEKTNNLTNVTQEYVWDTLASIPALLEDADNSYIYGIGSTPFMQVNKTTGAVSYLHGDERGSVILATDTQGTKEWSRSYDEYGVTYTQTPSAEAVTPFAYAGEYLDADTGLYNLRARWYEPSTASFISQDPALEITGEAYSYASANPLSYTDPLGLFNLRDGVNFSNALAGFMDGVTIIPIASTIANILSPGSVQTCSAFYKNAQGWGTFASLGLGGGSLVAKLGFGLAKKLAKTPTLVYDFVKMPATSLHKLEALNKWVAAGQPNKFTAISSKATTTNLRSPDKVTNWVNQNRNITTAPLKEQGSSPGRWNDEFPLASSKQGGVYARELKLGSTKKVPAWEQRIEGQMVKSFYNGKYDFDYRIAFKNIPKEYKHLLLKGIKEIR